MRRFFRGAALCALLAAALTAPATAHQPRGHVLHEHATARPADPDYAPPPPETLGGAFTMVDHTGQRVTEKMLLGKLTVIFFGFHGCREACPTALDKLPAVMQSLGDDARRIQPVFVDVSMEKMDVKGLAQWVSNFHPSLIGLTGSRAERFDIVRLYKVQREYKHNTYSTRETGPRLDHSTYFYIIDETGRTRSYFHHSKTPEEMVDEIRRWL